MAMDMQDLTTRRRTERRKTFAAPRFAQRGTIANPREAVEESVDDRELTDDEVEDADASKQFVNEVARELTYRCRDAYRCAWNMP